MRRGAVDNYCRIRTVSLPAFETTVSPSFSACSSWIPDGKNDIGMERADPETGVRGDVINSPGPIRRAFSIFFAAGACGFAS